MDVAYEYGRRAFAPRPPRCRGGTHDYCDTGASCANYQKPSCPVCGAPLRQAGWKWACRRCCQFGRH